MLTKDLLRFSLRDQKIFPRFLDTSSRNWQELSEALILTYEAGRDHSRETLAEQVQSIFNTARSPLIAKGLNKLLLDRAEFQETNAELELFRMKVFSIAAQQFSQGDKSGPYQEEEDRSYEQDDPPSIPSSSDTNNLEVFRQAVAQSLGLEPETLSSRLHADLPHRQVLLSFKPVRPEWLLHRYNVALAQSLLVWAETLLIEIEEPDIGIRRQFFHNLKRFQLLPQITQERPGKLRVQLDGPLNLFGSNNRKYGFKLAGFFPYVCALGYWKLQAKLRINTEEPALLELDQDTGLTSHYTRTTTYIPEEFERFAVQFEDMRQEGQKAEGWKIKKIPTLLNLERQEWIVPDFTFRHSSGQVVHLELFHRWHATPLCRRLEALPKQKKILALALGVDRFLTKDAQVKKTLQQSSWYQEHGFPFNGFPPVKRVVACLNGFLEQNEV